MLCFWLGLCLAKYYASPLLITRITYGAQEGTHDKTAFRRVRQNMQIVVSVSHLAYTEMNPLSGHLSEGCQSRE